MMHKYSDKTLTEDTLLLLERLASRERVKQLEEVLGKYPDILLEYQDYELNPHVLIVDTFCFERFITSIEVHTVKTDRAEGLAHDLKPFFFLNVSKKQIHISRFKTLILANQVRKDEVSKVTLDLSDDCADFSGLYYGYHPKMVVQFCFKEGYEHLIKK